jgi:hypothetical protein
MSQWYQHCSFLRNKLQDWCVPNSVSLGDACFAVKPPFHTRRYVAWHSGDLCSRLTIHFWDYVGCFEEVKMQFFNVFSIVFADVCQNGPSTFWVCDVT